MDIRGSVHTMFKMTCDLTGRVDSPYCALKSFCTTLLSLVVYRGGGCCLNTTCLVSNTTCLVSNTTCLVSNTQCSPGGTREHPKCTSISAPPMKSCCRPLTSRCPAHNSACNGASGSTGSEACATAGTDLSNTLHGLQSATCWCVISLRCRENNPGLSAVTKTLSQCSEQHLVSVQ